MENIELIDVVTAAADFLDEPENEEKFKKFEEIKQKTVVKAFLPLRVKSTIVDVVLKDVQKAAPDIYNFASAVEIALTFDALLAYTNINWNINQSLKDFDFYDVLWASGYCDLILKYCGKDYQSIVSMVDRLISYQNISDLFDSLNNINYESIENLNKSIENFKVGVDPQVVRDVAKIVESQDAAVKELNEAIDSAAMDAVKAIEKRETGEG